MKISKKHRLPWLNFANAYVSAANVISKKISESSTIADEQWRNEIMIIPLLFLLRHSLEIAIKSIFISLDKSFEPIHDLVLLSNEAKKHIDLSANANISKWNEIEAIVIEFANTKYGGKRFFKDDDINETSLRYYQSEVEEGYKELKQIKHEEIIKKVSRAIMLCEAFTLVCDTESYIN